MSTSDNHAEQIASLYKECRKEKIPDLASVKAVKEFFDILPPFEKVKDMILYVRSNETLTSIFREIHASDVAKQTQIDCMYQVYKALDDFKKSVDKKIADFNHDFLKVVAFDHFGYQFSEEDYSYKDDMAGTTDTPKEEL